MAFLLLFVIFWNFFLGAYTFTIRKKKIDDVIPCFRGTCPHDLRRGFASLPGFLSRSPPSHLYPDTQGSIRWVNTTQHLSGAGTAARGATRVSKTTGLCPTHIFCPMRQHSSPTHTHLIIIRTVTIVPRGKKENSRNFNIIYSKSCIKYIKNC